MRNIKLNINERRDILTQHGSIPTQQYLFENHLSVDGKFLIFQDNIFDLKENKLIGNISDSIDNFIFLIENVKFPIGPESKIVNEIKKIFSSSIISESITDWGLLIEQAKTEKSWWDKTKDWASDKIDTANKILKEKGLGALIGASALYIARRIKNALWTAAGMIIDTFMVASGIGKSVQWIPWAIAFVLDVYQWSTGDYGDDTEFKEASTFWKILTLGFEALGMLSAGPVALAAKKLFAPVKTLKTEGQIAQWVSKNPAAKSTLEKITNLIGSVGGKLQGLAKSFESSFPTLAKWIKGSMNLVGGFLTKIGNFLKKIWSLLGAPGRGARKVGEKIQNVTKINPKYNIGAGLQSATNVGMVLGGIEGVKKYGEYKQNQQIDSIINQSASPSDYESLTF